MISTLYRCDFCQGEVRLFPQTVTTERVMLHPVPGAVHGPLVTTTGQPVYEQPPLYCGCTGRLQEMAKIGRE